MDEQTQSEAIVALEADEAMELGGDLGDAKKNSKDIDPICLP
jgi:hypothetical protein